jgi:nucleoside-diphosphate-sugar epimerase
MENYFKNKKILITGGLGFIGSTLALRLVKMGSDICLVDSLIPDYGGNRFNINGIEDKVKDFFILFDQVHSSKAALIPASSLAQADVAD